MPAGRILGANGHLTAPEEIAMRATISCRRAQARMADLRYDAGVAPAPAPHAGRGQNIDW